MAYFARMREMQDYFRDDKGKSLVPAGVKLIARSHGTTRTPEYVADLLRLFVHGFMEGLTTGIEKQKTKILSEAFTQVERIKCDLTYEDMLTEINKLPPMVVYDILRKRK